MTGKGQCDSPRVKLCSEERRQPEWDVGTGAAGRSQYYKWVIAERLFYWLQPELQLCLGVKGRIMIKFPFLASLWTSEEWEPSAGDHKVLGWHRMSFSMMFKATCIHGELHHMKSTREGSSQCNTDPWQLSNQRPLVGVLLLFLLGTFNCQYIGT